MGKRIRLYEPGIVMSAVQGAIDRQFQFVPNHRPDNKLLHIDCHPNALDLANDIIPVPSTINIIGSSYARAQTKHPVRLHWLDGNINHLHLGFSLDEQQRPEVKSFLQQANSLVARQLNKQYEREGHLWAGRPRITPCRDDQAAEQQLFYALTNAVKDDLVERVAESPFISTFRQLAFGEPLRFWYLDYEAWWKRGGAAKKGNRLKELLRWSTLELTPLPGWGELTLEQRQTRVRQQVRAIEAAERDRRKDEKRTVVGVPALYKIDPRDRPKKPRASGPQPLCHASTNETRAEFRALWRRVMNEYRKASLDYRQGDWEREFPDGTYPPPIITIYTKSRL